MVPAWKRPQPPGLSGPSPRPRPQPGVGGSSVREGTPLRARVGFDSWRDLDGLAASQPAVLPAERLTCPGVG